MSLLQNIKVWLYPYARPYLSRLSGIQQPRRNRQFVERYRQTGRVFFAAELKQLLGCDDQWLQATAQEFFACPTAWEHLSGYQSDSWRTDGLGLTLDIAEGFALWTLVKHLRPQVVFELGVLYGASSRLWKEALKAYVPDHTLILCDLDDQRRFISDSEAIFYQEDALTVLPRVLQEYQVIVLHNDAHPYDLIHISIAMAQKHQVPCLTFHDVGHGRGRYNVFRLESSRLSKEQKQAHRLDLDTYGHWERHVMAEVFTPDILYSDAATVDGWRLQIFDSLSGFGVALKQ